MKNNDNYDNKLLLNKLKSIIKFQTDKINQLQKELLKKDLLYKELEEFNETLKCKNIAYEEKNKSLILEIQKLNYENNTILSEKNELNNKLEEVNNTNIQLLNEINTLKIKEKSEINVKKIQKNKPKSICKDIFIKKNDNIKSDKTNNSSCFNQVNKTILKRFRRDNKDKTNNPIISSSSKKLLKKIINHNKVVDNRSVNKSSFLFHKKKISLNKTNLTNNKNDYFLSNFKNLLIDFEHKIINISDKYKLENN